MISVLICDDSALMRDVLARALGSDPDIEVVGTASDPYEAREMIKRTNADVLTLDVEMPRMDGITFLENIMRLRPMPVVMVSSLTAKGANVSLDALQVGAFDVVLKPKNLEAQYDSFADELARTVRAAAGANVRARSQVSARRETGAAAAASAGSAGGPAGQYSPNTVFAVGASTGGVDAVTNFLKTFPDNAPPTFVVQHMPESFTKAFAERLARTTGLRVREAEDGGLVESGTCVIAPGGRHLKAERTARGWVSRLGDEDAVQGHRPSVDVLFQSLADIDGADVYAGVLTGMGSDGAEGLLALKNAGASTYGESEASALIYGMPRAAQRLGAVTHEGDPAFIGRHMIKSAASAAGRA